MAELMEVIKGRCSIRRHEDREVPEDLLQQLLEFEEEEQSGLQCTITIEKSEPSSGRFTSGSSTT